MEDKEKLETREIYMIRASDGRGNYNFKVSIPTAWAREMEMDVENKENRKLCMTFDGEKLVIKKAQE